MYIFNRLQLCAAILAGSLLVLFGFASAGLAGDSDSKAGTRILEALQQQYDLTEDEAITRLAAEAKAAAIHPGLKQFLGGAYAGAWFDSERLQLAVAITDPELEDWVKVADAHPVLVNRGLAELRRIQGELRRESVRSTQWNAAVTSWYIDYPTNSVVVEALPEHWGIAQARVAALPVDPSAIRMEVSAGRPELEYHVRGGDLASGCSIGFSVGGGFVWAGHCGTTIGASITGHDSQVIGNVAGTDWPQTDRGWVSTNAGVQLLPEINGFDDGVFTVEGSQNALQGTFVCRFGRTTGGPHCGTVSGLNQTVLFSGETQSTSGLTRADGVCSAGGDSGGPYVKGGTGLGVGTHTGGSGGCTSSAVKYFHPLENSLNFFNLTLLTGSGGDPPAITTFVCPDTANSGSGMFHCFVEYTSQGETQVDWTGPGNASGDSFFGSCGEHQQVNVTVTVSNGFGSDGRNASFICPTNPIP